MAAAANQAIWLNKLLANLGQEKSSPTKLCCDNKFTIPLLKIWFNMAGPNTLM